MTVRSLCRFLRSFTGGNSDPLSVQSTGIVTKMQWDELLNAARFGDERGPWRESTRSPFEQDQDRITYSTQFRRLAGKTQVFPLPESDVTHHRMTHTLEVASAGRSLGRLVVARTTGNERRELQAEVGAVIAAACLAHDLGNPPFGHSGEAAIAEFFRPMGAGAALLDDVEDNARSDFTEYEGNALGFRLLTRTNPQQSSDAGGLRLTYATLGAFLKYPRTSAPARLREGRVADHPGLQGASEKKFCAFADDRDSLERIASQLKLHQSPYVDRWRRHPFAFLVEAADDICNRVIDLEDAFRVRLVSFAEAESLLASVVEGDTSPPTERYKRIYDKNQKIGYLRARAIGVLLEQAAHKFISHAAGIEDGTFDSALVADIPAAGLLRAMEDVMKERVYNSPGVLAVEVAGFQIIGGLLSIFIDALINHSDSKKSKKVRALIPAHYLGPHSAPHDTGYANLISATEFVASMTDAYAIDLYRTLTGVQLPNY